ncbi:hypothetical protein J1605_003084 [Eschrichtius robustus]|uniref:SH3 domain-containing protein n=1 Tax=Eschrichtius robustus TaxID=9764 RepID=A0AB34HQX0_ESCRO|nr:hypothetical protein J1605_003084 [Eschrichtius robustus]
MSGQVEAIVEFDYQAQHDDELTITVGEIITNIRKEDGGWWEGQINGRRGLFPDNFVRDLYPALSIRSALGWASVGHGSGSCPTVAHGLCLKGRLVGDGGREASKVRGYPAGSLL